MKRTSRASPLRRYDHTVQRVLQALACSTPADFVKFGAAPVKGDLVLLSAAPDSDWHLSFYIEREASDVHLLESIKTGAIGRWSNVRFLVLNAESWGIERQMRWTDAQFAFNDRFVKACRLEDVYMEIPYIDRFEGDMVHLAMRTRHALSDVRTPLRPITYEGVKLRHVRELIREGVALQQQSSAPPAGGAGA